MTTTQYSELKEFRELIGEVISTIGFKETTCDNQCDKCLFYEDERCLIRGVTGLLGRIDYLCGKKMAKCFTFVVIKRDAYSLLNGVVSSDIIYGPSSYDDCVHYITSTNNDELIILKVII